MFSDLYEDSEQFISSLKHAAVKKLDVIVIHMIDQAEFLLNDIEGQIRFVDMETQQSTMTDVQFIREEYRRLMQKFIDDCSAYCLSSGMGYCVVSGEQLWQNVLSEFLASYFTRNS